MDMQIIWHVLATMRQLRKRDKWSRQQLDTHQANALRSLREYAYAHAPFYQRFHRGLTSAPLHELPVLTKAMVMEHFDELVTDRAIRLEAVKAHLANLSGDERFLGRYRVIATSGSSGHPGIFLFNRAEWMKVLASFARAREWGGVKLDLTHRVKTATVASTSAFHMSMRVNATAQSWWMPEIRLYDCCPNGASGSYRFHPGFDHPSERVIPSLLALVDPAHVLFGSDYPWAGEAITSLTLLRLESYQGIDQQARAWSALKRWARSDQARKPTPVSGDSDAPENEPHSRERQR